MSRIGAPTMACDPRPRTQKPTTASYRLLNERVLPSQDS